jgi:hypothetical protein
VRPRIDGGEASGKKVRESEFESFVTSFMHIAQGIPLVCDEICSRVDGRVFAEDEVEAFERVRQSLKVAFRP